MVIQTITTNGCPQTIVIGRRGTYDTLQITFDLRYLVETYGNGVAVLAVKRSQDESAYPAVVTQAEDVLTWTVSETDTAYVGAGECQLMWFVDGGLAKTIIYPMVVMRDILSTSEEPPDGYENWVESLIAEGSETLQNAQDAAQSASDAEDAKDDAVAAKEAAEAALEEFTTPTASATTLAAGSQATAEYSDGNFAFGIPRGADGLPGTPGAPGADGVTPDFSIGTVTTLEPTQPATATITGTPAEPVLNLGIPQGPKGDPGGSTGTTDYRELENKPQINGHTLNGDQSASDLGLGTYSKPGTGIPKTDLASDVQQSLDKADSALQSAPVSSVAGKTGAVQLNAGEIEFDETETYAAGSIGAEVSQQKNAIDSIGSELHPIATKTLLYTDITWDRGFLKSDGSVNTSTSYMVSAYLPVSAGDSVVYDGLRSSSSIYPCLCGYDSSKNFVSGSNVAGDGTASQSGTYTVPNGVAFIRVSTYDYAGTIRFNSITMPVAGDRLDGFDDEFEVVDDRLDAIEAAIPMYQYTLGFDDFEYTTGKVASKEGETTRADGQVTDYISTANMLSVSATTVRMPVMTTDKLVAVIGCYDSSKNLLESKSVFATGTYGQFVNITGSVTITRDIAYIRLSRLSGSADTSIFVVTKERTLSADYDVTKAEVADIEERIDSVWKGKKWYAFGTSLTDDRYLDPNGDPTGKYPDILNQWMKANLVNCGQGGGSITNYNSRIMNKINNTDFSDADIVTLEGFPNDYAMPIGDLLDTTMDTLAGAIYTAVTKIYEVAPNATVVLITASQGQMNEQGTAGYPIWFSDGKQLKFNEMTIRMAHYLGCHVIDAGGKAQINNFHPEYLVDHIHHSWAGGWQYAATIWEEMKLIHPNTNNPYLEEEEEP